MSTNVSSVKNSYLDQLYEYVNAENSTVDPVLKTFLNSLAVPSNDPPKRRVWALDNPQLKNTDLEYSELKKGLEDTGGGLLSEKDLVEEVKQRSKTAPEDAFLLLNKQEDKLVDFGLKLSTFPLFYAYPLFGDHIFYLFDADRFLQLTAFLPDFTTTLFYRSLQDGRNIELILPSYLKGNRRLNNAEKAEIAEQIGAKAISAYIKKIANGAPLPGTKGVKSNHLFTKDFSAVCQPKEVPAPVAPPVLTSSISKSTVVGVACLAFAAGIAFDWFCKEFVLAKLKGEL